MNLSPNNEIVRTYARIVTSAPVDGETVFTSMDGEHIQPFEFGDYNGSTIGEAHNELVSRGYVKVNDLCSWTSQTYRKASTLLTFFI